MKMNFSSEMWLREELFPEKVTDSLLQSFYTRSAKDFTLPTGEVVKRWLGRSQCGPLLDDRFVISKTPGIEAEGWQGADEENDESEMEIDEEEFRDGAVIQQLMLVVLDAGRPQMPLEPDIFHQLLERVIAEGRGIAWHSQICSLSTLKSVRFALWSFTIQSTL
eukprot:s69_g39.t1